MCCVYHLSLELSLPVDRRIISLHRKGSLTQLRPIGLRIRDSIISTHLNMSAATAANKARVPNPVGHSIPAHSVHGISVSLPTWKDNIRYEEGDAGVIEKIKSAYPRFKIHYLIENVRLVVLIISVSKS
jgi:hypothetical protein